ncbi:MAG: HAMP domain-containing histidine kinase [Erysipelotrichaceae bacterium]|nr:HAMP domain-containing histidine kinase [Erysipelotrichaceae bacterium]
MKKTKLSLKWTISAYFLALVLVSLLGIFLVVEFALPKMYQKSRIDLVEDVADEISVAIESGLNADYLDTISRENDLCVRVETSYDGIASTTNATCSITALTHRDVMDYVQKASRNGGDYLETLQYDSVTYEQKANGEFAIMRRPSEFKSIVYAKLIELNNRNALILVNTSLTPISSTVSILYKLIILVGIVTIAMALILTFVLNKQLINPMLKMNEAAKDLPDGKYHFHITSPFKEMHELNDTLTESSEQINKAEAAHKALISNVSHDLRTPLTMISGYSEMMRDFPGERTDDNLKIVLDESAHLSMLVNDLLEYSRLSEKRITLATTSFDFSELVRETVSSYIIKLQEKGFTIDTSIDDECMVEGDKGRLKQVLMNFIDNAINYSIDDKHLDITVKKENDRIRCMVSDHGVGISEKDKADIWNRYVKSSKSKGTGLGLAIASEILQLHKAEYGVDSEVGKGSTFWFTLTISAKH